MTNLPLTHDNIRAILAGNVRPTEVLIRICFQLLDEVEAEAADCATFGKAHEQAVEMLKAARAERDQANAEAKRWRDVADALSVKLTGVTAEGLVAVPREAMKCEAPQSDGCQYPPTHIAEYLTGKTPVVNGDQLPITHRIPVCGACANDVPGLHRVQRLGGAR